MQANSENSANFSNNLHLLMSHLKIKTQSDLARDIDFKKTTINKWLVTGAIPKSRSDSEEGEDNLHRLCANINEKYFNKMNKINPDLLLGDPYDFATVINMPWYKVSSVVNGIQIRLPIKDLVFKHRELYSITGFYQLFFPSVVYEGAFFAAALKITVDREDELFYFEGFNHESGTVNQNRKARWPLPSLYQSGLVGRFGEEGISSAVLITGDLVREEREEHVYINQQFMSFKIPPEPRPEKLLGMAIALNFNKKSPSYGHLIATPAVALVRASIPGDRSVKELAPEEPYLDLDEMNRNYPEALRALQQAPVSWYHSSIHSHKASSHLTLKKASPF